jgi:transposase
MRPCQTPAGWTPVIMFMNYCQPPIWKYFSRYAPIYLIKEADMSKINSHHSDADIVYMGIDVHEATYNISLFNQGEEILSQHCNATYDSIRKILKRFRAFSFCAVYEAGAFGYNLHDRLKADHVAVIVTPPSKILRSQDDVVKTDKRDARKLAQLLAAGLLKSVCVPSMQIRQDRELQRTRDQLSDQRRRIYQQIQSKLRLHGLPLRCKGTITAVKKAALLQLPLSAPVRIAFNELINLYDFYSQRLRFLRNELIKLAESKPYAAAIRLLQSIPGVGLFTSLAWVLELPPMKHFLSDDKLASFLGLTPMESSSGSKRRLGSISKCGNPKIRWLLIQCSWILIGKDPVMQQFYSRIKRRHGSQCAIVAVARKLSARIRAVLINQTPYVIGTIA